MRRAAGAGLLLVMAATLVPPQAHAQSGPCAEPAPQASAPLSQPMRVLPSTPPRRAAPAPYAPAVSMRVYAQMGDGTQQRGPALDGAHVNDLHIVVEWRYLGAPRRQRLELYTPAGHLYQTLTGVVSPKTPYSDQPAAVPSVVPVAGTWIRNFGLYGTWCARVYLDDATTPSLRQTFVLTAPN